MLLSTVCLFASKRNTTFEQPSDLASCRQSIGLLSSDFDFDVFVNGSYFLIE